MKQASNNSKNQQGINFERVIKPSSAKHNNYAPLRRDLSQEGLDLRFTSSLYERSDRPERRPDSGTSKQESKGHTLAGEEGAWAIQDAMKALIAKNKAL